MEWVKKGLIFGPSGKYSWAKHSALQPTPILLKNGIIRVFAGFRDELGVGRVGYVDVSAENPLEVLDFSIKPVLDVGMPGTFDDNGVVPCAIVSREDKLYLYYAGYQVTNQVRFIAFTGLAISEDNGKSFMRTKNVPLLERTHDEFLFRVIHSAFYDGEKWKIWYGAGNSFKQGAEKTLPEYNIRYMESVDGINFPPSGKVCLDVSGDEYRVGRPYVIYSNGIYKMFFAASTQSSPFRLAYAESKDGIDWVRDDKKVFLEYGGADFDSEMSSYPSIIQTEGKTYMFYNGNNYGKFGFGYAELKG